MLENDNFFQIPFDEFFEFRQTVSQRRKLETQSPGKFDERRCPLTPAIPSASDDILCCARPQSLPLEPLKARQNADTGVTENLVVNRRLDIHKAFTALLSSQAEERLDVSAARRADLNVFASQEHNSQVMEHLGDQEDSSLITLPASNLETNGSKQEREQLQEAIGVAQKRLSDDEQRILELRRVHRELHKKAIRAEQHIDRLTETHKRQNEISTKKIDEKKRTLEFLRTTVLDAELRSNQLDDLLRREQDHASTLELSIIERRRELVRAINRREQLRLEHDRLTEAKTTFEEILSQAEAALLEAEQNYYDSESNAILDSFFVDNSDEEIDIHAQEDHLEPRVSMLIAEPEDRSQELQVPVESSPLDNESNEAPVANSPVQSGPPVFEPAVCEPVSEEEASYQFILKSFDDPSIRIQHAALRALLDLPDPGFALTRAMRESTPERCRIIAQAIAQSGVAQAAINDLDSEFRSRILIANTVLLLMCKAGELGPLVRSIDEHRILATRQAAITILLASGHPEATTILRRVVVRGSLPDTVRSAALNGLQQLGSVQHLPVSSAA